MRIGRRALTATLAAGLLAAPALHMTRALAQTTTQKGITTTVTVLYAPPVGVTGVQVSLTCNNLREAQSSLTTAAVFPLTGGIATYYFPIAAPGYFSPTDAGSNCAVSTSLVYAAGYSSFSATIAPVWGGAPLKVQSTSDGTYNQATQGRNALDTADLRATPVADATTLGLTIGFPPSVTVTKAVTGSESVVGFAYPMALACSNDSGATLLPVNAITAGSTAAAAYPYHRIVSLKSGANWWITASDFVGYGAATSCYVGELDSRGASLRYDSISPTGTVNSVGVVDGSWRINSTSTGVIAGAGLYRSSWTAAGSRVIVNNGSTGSLVVSKVVTGDPRSNVGIYEINVSCTGGGPVETFLLRDRQARQIDNIPAGAFCQVLETRSDGAVTVTYSDNSGPSSSDGRVDITTSPAGCSQLGSTSTTGTYTSCVSSVLVVNDYTPLPTTTLATTTIATTTSAPTTTAPPVTAAPATPVTETPAYTG